MSIFILSHGVLLTYKSFLISIKFYLTWVGPVMELYYVPFPSICFFLSTLYFLYPSRWCGLGGLGSELLSYIDTYLFLFSFARILAMCASITLRALK